MKVVRLLALSTGRLYLQEIFLVLISVRGWVNPKNIVRPEWSIQWKNPLTPSRFEPTSRLFVALCLNQLLYGVPLFIYIYIYIFIYLFTKILSEDRVSQSLYIRSGIRWRSEQWFGNYVAWSPSWLSLIYFQDGLRITTTLIRAAASTVISQPMSFQYEAGMLSARWVLLL